MPSHSRASLASGTGSSTKQGDRDRPTSSISVEKSIPLTPLSKLLDPELPLPVTHRRAHHASSSLSLGRRGGQAQKKLRIDINGDGENLSFKDRLRLHWARFLRRLGSGSAPSSSSVIDDSTGESVVHHGNSRAAGASDDVDELLDEVVVDREWGEELQRTTSASHSEPDKEREKERSGGSHHQGGTNTDRESLAAEGFWACCTTLAYLRWRVWPFVIGFFWTRFIDEKSEESYSKENWFMRKKLAIWSALFFVLNWVLAAAIVPRPYILPDWIFYFCITPVLTFPLLAMVIYDFPRDRALAYQSFLVLSTWSWGIYQLVSINICHFYTKTPTKFSCGTKDFLSTFYYTSALQTIGLFGLKLHRFPAMVGMMTFFVVSFVMVVPERKTFIRNVVNFFCFQAFLLYVHYMRENAERRLYTLRDQLKIQYRATQKAQFLERKAADSKRRLTSYVFHEVRVPLNTALLAVQNMEATGSVARAQEVEFRALEGSLNMMSKVLNDVLDFNRMDSGRFESVARPYAFHAVMHSLFVPLRLATDARQLRFVTEFDREIDRVARRALYESEGVQEAEIRRRMAAGDEDGVVVGDETRLRQIITNLASNACKFTPAGGQLTIRTRLLLPDHLRKDERGASDEAKSPDLSCPASPELASSSTVSTPVKDGDDHHLQLSTTHLSRHNNIHSKPPPPLEWIVVRIEVSDTGCGIRRKDMINSKLFSAFNQTEMGRQQGGKGTGLGLALVRQIVKLSGGRLGLQSKVNEGSTFWVELPLGIGAKAQAGLRSVPNSPEQPQESTNNGLSSLLDGAKDVPLSILRRYDMQTSHTRAQTRSSSAMHSIMEQGGLVELSANRNDDSLVLTRTIGDPLTGTDLITPGIQEDAESPLQIAFDLPTPTNDVVTRPKYLQLPAPQEFSLDNVPGPSLPTPPSSTLGRYSGGLTPPPTSPGGQEPALRVLVVDDDPLTRKLMSRMLTRIGCRVSTAENGEIALEMILGVRTRMTPSSEETESAGLCTAENGAAAAGPSANVHEYKYAIVFLDNQMPVMSGLETVAKLRELGRRDFVVGVTGNALLSDQQEYLEAGVDHILTKPVYEKSLRAMLDIAEERQKQRTPAFEVPDPSLQSGQ